MTSESPIYVAVGNAAQWQVSGLNLPWETDVLYVEFKDLEPGDIRDWEPKFVLSPLLDLGFDCMDVARVLQNANFGGYLRILSPALPRPNIVLSEIKALYPQLKIDFFSDNVAPFKTDI